MIASVQRADQILDLFSSEIPSWTVTEVAQELGLSKSIVWEYLKTLEHLGILRRDGYGRYRLGWRTFELGRNARVTSEIATSARQEISRLASRFGESFFLTTRHHTSAVVLESAVPAGGLRPKFAQIGDRMPAHATACGKVLLSQLTESDISNLYPNSDLERVTDHTLENRESLIKELEIVDSNGFAVDREEFAKGIQGIAAPITNHLGRVSWSLSVTFYSYKSGSLSEAYREALISSANYLSDVAWENSKSLDFGD
ncbi:IclR family transcriptional regulator [Corynebacterium sp. S7]